MRGNLAITSITGKLGGAVLNALLDSNLVPVHEIVACTSSDPASDSRLSTLQSKGLRIRQQNFDDPASMEQAYANCEKLFIVSTPRISMDFNDAPPGKGREAHHKAAIDAARKAGVKHIYYTSLAFGEPSKAGVMRAHLRTEEYLKSLTDIKYTIIREGLYNESWPLYFGYYFGLEKETRKEVIVPGDGKVSWTAIPDMAFATAKILADDSSKWAGKTFYLSQKKAVTLKEIADIVSKARRKDITPKVVPKAEHERFYIEEKGMEKPAVEWWSSSYDALQDGECEIDDPTLETILSEAGRTPKPVEQTIKEMLR